MSGTLCSLRKRLQGLLPMDHELPNDFPLRRTRRPAAIVVAALAILAALAWLPAGATQEAAGRTLRPQAMGITQDRAVSKPPSLKGNKVDTGGVLRILPYALLTTTYEFTPGQIYTLL